MTTIINGSSPSITFSDGTVQGTAANLRTQVFASSTTWTAPIGCSYINAVVIGGGGGGGGSTSSGVTGGYGGLAGMASGEIAVVGGTTYTLTVGAGGAGSNSTNGSAGGTTSIGSLISATGGGGGTVNGAGSNGSYGAGTNGTIANKAIAFYGAAPFVGEAQRPEALSSTAAVAWTSSLNSGGNPIGPGSRGSPETDSGANNASGGVGGAIIIQYVG